MTQQAASQAFADRLADAYGRRDGLASSKLWSMKLTPPNEPRLNSMDYRRRTRRSLARARSAQRSRTAAGLQSGGRADGAAACSRRRARRSCGGCARSCRGSSRGGCGRWCGRSGRRGSPSCGRLSTNCLALDSAAVPRPEARVNDRMATIIKTHGGAAVRREPTFRGGGVRPDRHGGAGRRLSGSVRAEAVEDRRAGQARSGGACGSRPRRPAGRRPSRRSSGFSTRRSPSR